MARTIAPQGAPTPGALKIDVPNIDLGIFGKVGDAKIEAANANFNLHVQNAYKSQANDAYSKFSSDPIQLSNALGKIADGVLSGVPEEIADKYRTQFLLNATGLVQKAENNRVARIDQENRQAVAQNIADINKSRVATYSLVLQDHIAKAEDKRPVNIDIFLDQQRELEELAALKDSNGKNVYTPKQRAQIVNASAVQLEAGKQFVDNMILNDDEDLTQTKNYYTKFILAPERFMKENFMDRAIYDAFKTYTEKQLKAAGADIKNARFNQSQMDALSLQVAYAPEKMKRLQEDGLLNKKLVKHIENTTAKFERLDPTKTDSPIAMINALEIIHSLPFNPAPMNQEQQQEVLEQGLVALDSIAQYAESQGMSPNTVQSAREAVVNKEISTAYADILKNFNNISHNILQARKRINDTTLGRTLTNITSIDGMDDDELVTAIELNNLLSNSVDQIHTAMRSGDFETAKKIQQDTWKAGARIRYRDADWATVDQNPDAIIELNGYMGRIKGYTPNADIIFDTIN